MTDTATMPPPDAPAAAEFSPVRICTRHDPRQAPEWGQAAFVDGLGLVVRTRRGTALIYSRPGPGRRLDHDPSEPIPPEMRGHPTLPVHDLTTDHAVTIDPAATIAKIVDQHHGLSAGWAELDLTTPGDREIGKFQHDYPLVAAMLGVSALGVDDGLFHPGTVLVARQIRACDAWQHVVQWRECLDRHRFGDHGEFGAHSEMGLSPEEVFSLGYQPQNRINDHAVKVESGLIRSRYPIEHPSAPAPPARSLVWVCEVLTHLAGPRTTTLAYVASVQREP